MPYGTFPYGVDPYGNLDAPTIGDTVEVELPGVYVDNLVFDEVSAALMLVNQVPEKGSTQNQADTSISFDIFDTSGAAIDLSTLVVTVDGVVAHAGGVFSTGWDGPGSMVTDNGTVVQVTIDPTTNFDSEATVVVNVKVSDFPTGLNGIPLSLNETYAFKIEDITKPVLLSAMALDHETVRLEFTEPMTAEAPENPDDALNPANYTFEALSVPAVPLVAVSVAKTSNPAMFDVTVDIEMSPNALYKVTVLNTEDLFDNMIEPPDNVAEFAGYACPKPADRDLLLWDWVPDYNKREDVDVGHLKLFVDILQDVVDLLFCLIDRFSEIYDVDLAPEPFVDAMLKDLGNPFPFVLSLPDKRRLARVLVEIYRQKGTKQGIINVIRFFLGVEVEIEVLNNSDEQWVLGESELGEDTWLGPSDQYLLYSFRIIAPYALTEEQRERIVTIANYMKVAHEHLIELKEPVVPVEFDHWELGFSLLGEETILH